MADPIAGSIAGQTSPEDHLWTFQVPSDVFSDPDGDALILSATLVGGDPLPSWLSFDPASRTFSGQPPEDFFGTLDIEVTAGDGQGEASASFALEIVPENDAPRLTFAPLYADDFEAPGTIEWLYYSDDDVLQDVVPVAEDDEGNASLDSTGPWWVDPNHAPPGAGFLHLLAVIYGNGSHSGIFIHDFRDLEITFDIRTEGLELPEGANLYFWIQSTDHKLQWGEGQTVNYAYGANAIQDHLVEDEWATVTINFSSVDADWIALGSSQAREATYSISASAADALAGTPIDMGLIMLLGDEPVETAVGEVRLDNIIITETNVARRHFEAGDLAAGTMNLGLKVAVSDVEDSTFEGYSVVLSASPETPATFSATLDLAPGGHLTQSGGQLFLDGAEIGSVGTGAAGELLHISLTAPVAASIVAELVAAIVVSDPAAAPGQLDQLQLTLIDADGAEASIPVEVYADAPPYDGSADDVVLGTDSADTLSGGGGNDRLEGGDGNDRLDGNSGQDTTVGSLGDDWHFVDDAADIIVEVSGEGTADRVFAGLDYTLAADADIEIFSTDFNPGTAAIDLTGNGLSQFVYGNAGANQLDGAGGGDTLLGFGGDDRFLIRSGADRVVESAGEGTDRVFAATSFTLETGSHVEILSTIDNLATTAINLTGNALTQHIFGNAGANQLDSGGGGDKLLGLGGDDRYFVRTGADRVVESAGEGNDRILAATGFALAAGSHVEILSTIDNLATATINLTGNELSQYVYGNAGANLLDGAGGGDTLLGLGGDDRYYVRSGADRVVEAAGEGTDRILATVSFTLEAGSHVEIMSTIDNLATTAINLAGNALSQQIFGNAGANQLDGAGGGDKLLGLGGDDRYVVRSGVDRVVESAGEGSDRILAATGFVLEAGSHVEIMSTIDNLATTAINLTGNELSQYIYGNAGANLLDGKLGSDVLIGLEGVDTFAFTTAPGAGNVDEIRDFAPSVDRIALDDAVFTGLGPGTLPAGAFATGVAATGADDRILYDPVTGGLYFDADGTGAVAAVQFATLSPGLALASSDFVVI